MIPQVNATVTKVTGGAASEDWDTPAGVGATVWTGSADAYYSEKRERVTGQQADLVLRRSLIVDTDFRVWSEGEIVTFETEQGAQTGKVKVIEARALSGNPLSTTRLTLADA